MRANIIMCTGVDLDNYIQLYRYTYFVDINTHSGTGGSLIANVVCFLNLCDIVALSKIKLHGDFSTFDMVALLMLFSGDSFFDTFDSSSFIGKSLLKIMKVHAKCADEISLIVQKVLTT